MTYADLIRHLADGNEELCPVYCMKHLTVNECFCTAPEDAEWGDSADGETIKSVKEEMEAHQ